MGFGANASQVYSATYPGFQATQSMAAGDIGAQAGATQEQANNELTVANYNSSLTAFQANQAESNQAETYNAGGVMLSGSPLGVLEQTRQLAGNQIANIQNQALLQSNLTQESAIQTVNNGISTLLGNQESFTAGQANADIQQQNVGAEDAAAALSVFSPALGSIYSSAIKNVTAPTIPGIGSGNTSGISTGSGSLADPLTTLNSSAPGSSNTFSSAANIAAGEEGESLIDSASIDASGGVVSGVYSSVGDIADAASDVAGVGAALFGA